MQDDGSATTALAPAPARVLGSDPHDFAGLYIRHRSSFTSHARRYLRDPRDADEVVQEAFLRLFLALPELETELQALAYCRRTITNLCIDRYRADARRPRLVALDGATVDGLADDDTGDPVVRAEDAALVREALSQLPPLHRAALVKREIEEKPLPVIAGELDVAEDSVKHLLFRARRALRGLLAGTSVAPGADVEHSRRLLPATRGASGGVAGLLLLALLGLGSGPDLRAVPVVGVDLPDVLGVTTVAEAVGDAVRDVVGVIAPRDEADAATGEGLSSRPASRSELLPDSDASASAAAGQSSAQVTAGGAAGAAHRRPADVTGAQPGLPAGARPTTVVTVVDGVPVVTVVPPTGALPGAGPVVGGGATTPGGSTGSLPGLPTTVPPAPPGGSSGVPAGTPAAPAAEAPVRPGGSGSSGRSPRADAVAKATDKAADKAADAADKAEKVAGKGVEKAADVAAKASAKAAEKAKKAADKAMKKSAEAAAERAAQQAAAQRAAEQAASVAATTTVTVPAP